MQFFVKVRVNTAKLTEFGQKLQTGVISSHPTITYCLQEDPTIGLNIWEAENRDEFERLFGQHKDFYSEIFEIKQVISSKEAQKILLDRMKK